MNFSEGGEMYKIISSPNVECSKAFELLLTIHSYFAEFNNKYIPLYQNCLTHDPSLSTFENCTKAIPEIKKVLGLIKDFIYYPTVNKPTTLLKLAKLVEDLIECVAAYVELVE